MKRIKYGLIALCLGALTTSCSSDYLNLSPDSDSSPEEIFQTTKGAQQAVNGLSKMMSQQYLGNQWFNGEGSIKSLFGNFTGNDYQRTVYVSGLDKIANLGNSQLSTAIYDYYPWFYYYRIIGNANKILQRVGKSVGTEQERQYIKAQALTFRAYCYSMLVQFYSKRWMDSGNGASRGVVLRLDESRGDMPTSTLGETYTQIYKDLDEAISLFKESGMKRAVGNNYSANINVAYAVYARAALNREDWSTAAEYAALARNGYPLMSNDEYVLGFNTPNSEWIWSVYSSEQETLYYYQYFAYEGCNSTSTWGTSRPATISKELFDKIPASDIRRSLFLDPKDDAYTAASNAAGKTLAARARRDYADHLQSNSSIYAFMQFKQMAKAQPGVGEINLFRSSEMYLIEAEADCHLGKYPEAQQLLVALNATSGRNPEYTCTKTGDDLLEEVRLYNRIELWGEGHDWFNYKRWGLPIVRKSAANGGNFLTQLAVTIKPTDNNGWTWVIPSSEVDYNSDILGSLEK